MVLAHHRPLLEKKSPQKTKREQPNRTAEPTQVLTPVETDTGGVPRGALAQAKTDTGGETRGGVTDKQIKFLQMLADRVGAEHAEDLWRAADPKRLQAQIKAAVPFKAKGGEHTHAAFNEVIFRIGIENKIGFKEGVQRCECGAARAAGIDRAGDTTFESPWTLSGYLVDYLAEDFDLCGPMTDQEMAEADDTDAGDIFKALDGRWAAPMTFSDVKHLYETLPGERMSGGVDDGRDVPADWNRVAAEAEDKARVAAEAKDKEWRASMAEFEEKARVEAEAKGKAWVAAHAEEKDREQGSRLRPRRRRPGSRTGWTGWRRTGWRPRPRIRNGWWRRRRPA